MGAASLAEALACTELYSVELQETDIGRSDQIVNAEAPQEVGKVKKSPKIELTEDPADPPLRVTAPYEYLQHLRDQIKWTSNQDKPRIVLEIARQPKLVGRVAVAMSGTDYDAISGGKLGPSYLPDYVNDPEIVPFELLLSDRQLLELAALNKYDRTDGPHTWVTSFSSSVANGIQQEITEMLQRYEQ